MHKNNTKENENQLPCKHSVGQQAMIKADQCAKCGADACAGPHTVTQVNANGALHADDGAVEDACNVHNIVRHNN